MSAHSVPHSSTTTSAFWPAPKAWKSVLTHLLIPLVMGAGMALAYLGAFHSPAPHHVPLAVVGQSAASKAFAQSLNDAGEGKLEVSTVATPGQARQQIKDQKLAGAYFAGEHEATIFISSASGEAGAASAEKVFSPLAFAAQLPVQLEDVQPAGANDAGGQALFFMLVAISVGSYASVVALAGATAGMKLPVRLLIAAGTAVALSSIATLVAGPVYQVLNGNEWAIWGLGALYSFGIITIGLGLHPILGKWTTPALTFLFVMMNFTSSGGVYPAYLAPEFFAGLNTFWNGAAWLESAKDLSYFPGASFAWAALRLTLWAVAGVALVLLTHLATLRRTRLANDAAPVSVEEEEASLLPA